MNEEITEEELLQIKKQNTINKKINSKVNSHNSTKIILLIVLIISLILCVFVWTSSIENDEGQKGYLIKINYAEYEKNNLELSYDPNFDDKFFSLLGLGYGDVDSNIGGSLLKPLEMNVTMFEKFSNFAKNNKVASQYVKNEGSANFDQYYCNKYYIKNTGDEEVYFRLNLEVTENYNNVLDACRFMFVTNDSSGNYNFKIFATPNKETGLHEVAASKMVTEADYSGPIYIADPNISNDLETKNCDEAWLCDDLIMDELTGFYHYYSSTNTQDLFKLAPGEYMCYTICVWLEASDIDHTNDIKGGSISFSINYETEAYLYWKKQLKTE